MSQPGAGPAVPEECQRRTEAEPTSGPSARWDIGHVTACPAVAVGCTPQPSQRSPQEAGYGAAEQAVAFGPEVDALRAKDAVPARVHN